MPTTTRIHVDGLSELGRRMATLKADVALKMAPRATGKAGQVVKRAAKSNLKSSPSIDSGLVEKNVIVKKLGKRQTDLTAEHIVTVKKKDYPLEGNDTKKKNTRQVAGYLEEGTVNMPPEPFLRRALHQNINPSINAMAVSLEADLKKAGS